MKIVFIIGFLILVGLAIKLFLEAAFYHETFQFIITLLLGVALTVSGFLAIVL